MKTRTGLTKSRRFSFKSLYRENEGVALPFSFDDKSPIPRPEQDVFFDWIRFYLYKEVIGIESKHTARAKTYDLHKLLVYFEFSCGHQKVGLWGKAFTASFVSALEREYEISTVYRIFATVANFVKFLILHEIIKPVDNPTDGIRLQDQELPPPKGVQLIATGPAKAFYLSSAKMYDLLMSAAQYFIKKKDPKNKRDRTMPYRDAAIVAYSTILVFVLKRSAVSHCPRWI